MEAFQYLLSTNRRPNKEIKQYNGDIFSNFVNSEQNNWTNLLPMVEFIYNNAKNASTGCMSFKIYCKYYTHIYFKDDNNFLSKALSAENFFTELKYLMSICQQNLLHTQEFQKQTYDKRVKLKSYTSGKKIWLNSNYIKIK